MEFVIGGTKLWIVVQSWPGGKVVHESAWFSEDAARQRAGVLVGRDGALLSLLSIDVKDGPPMAVPRPPRASLNTP